MLIGDTFLPLFGLDQDPRSKIGSRPYLFHLRNSSRLLCVQYWSDWKRFSTGENSIFFTRTKTCKLNFTPRKLGKTLALTLNKKGYIWKINVDNSIKLGCANLLKKRLNISRTCSYFSQTFYPNLPIFYIRIYPSFFLFQMFPLSIFYSLISCFKRFWGR